VWLWLSLGAAACVVCGVLFRGAMNDNQDNESIGDRAEKSPIPGNSRCDQIKHRTVEDSEENPCVEDGDTLLRQLRLEDWHIRTSDSMDGLNFSSMTNPKLVRMAGELWFALRKNIISLETACERYQTENNVMQMLKEILVIHKDALEALKKFAKDVLNLDVQKQVLSARAQGYPHCMCFLADHGTCVEIVAALAVSFPSWQRVCRRLRDELKKSRPHWNRNHFKLLDELARPIDDFDEIAIKALNEGLSLQDTSRGRIESSTKVLEESEKLFWEHIVAAGEFPNLRMTESDVNLLLPTTRELDCWGEVDQVGSISSGEPGADFHSHRISEIDFLEDLEIKEDASYTTTNKIAPGFLRHESVGDLRTPSRKPHLVSVGEVGRKRSNTVPDVVYHSTHKRFDKMSQAEQEIELNEMNCLMESLVSNFNKMQDEQSSSSGEKTASAESPDAVAILSQDSEELAEISAMTRKLTELTTKESRRSRDLGMSTANLIELELTDSKDLLSDTI